MRAGSLAGGEQASVVVFLSVFVCFGRFFFWGWEGACRLMHPGAFA